MCGHAERRLREDAVRELNTLADIHANRIETLIARNFERLGLIQSRTQLRISLAAWNRDGETNRLNRMRLRYP